MVVPELGHLKARAAWNPFGNKVQPVQVTKAVLLLLKKFAWDTVVL